MAMAIIDTIYTNDVLGYSVRGKTSRNYRYIFS